MNLYARKKHVCLYWDVLGVLFFAWWNCDVTSMEATKLVVKVEEI